MKKSKQYALILAIGIIIVGLSVFLNLNNLNYFNTINNLNNSTKAFSKNNISFDYPGSWQDYTEKANIKKATEIDTETNKTYSRIYLTNEYLAAVGDPNTARANGESMPTTAFIVTKTEDTVNSTGNFSHPEGFMSEALIQSWVNTTNATNMYPNYINVKITTRNFTLSGLKAYEFTYTGFHTSNNKYEYTRIIAFEKRYPHKEVNYVIMCATMASDIGETKTLFNKIINTFKVQ